MKYYGLHFNSKLMRKYYIQEQYAKFCKLLWCYKAAIGKTWWFPLIPLKGETLLRAAGCCHRYKFDWFTWSWNGKQLAAYWLTVIGANNCTATHPFGIPIHPWCLWVMISRSTLKWIQSVLIAKRPRSLYVHINLRQRVSPWKRARGR